MVMDVAKHRKASIITVTDTHVSPAAKRSDVPLVIPYRLKMYGNSVAVFALLDSLLGTLSLRYPETTRQRLDSLEELYEQFNLLSKPEE
jgi:DNA-binding MurR/RpiR family transcriptional regulator